MQESVRGAGAQPLVTGFLAGEPVAGLDDRTIERFGSDPPVAKAGLADLPVVLARGLDAATTVATTAWIALRKGIRVVATGGIGGVHRTADGLPSADVSGDLEALASTPVTVVCSGPKAVLDLTATRERLESSGVTVVGYGTDTLPAFWFADSGLPVDVRCDTPAEVAALARARDGLGTGRALLVCVPVPPDAALDRDGAEEAIRDALHEAEQASLSAGAVTPFLLSRLADVRGGALLRANVELLRNNARVAGLVAAALAEDVFTLPGSP